VTEHAYIAAAIEELLARLRGAEADAAAARERREAAARGEPALATVAGRLGLTGFERELLLLAAAAQLDPRVPVPTYALAASALDGAHWSAITPGRPLRRLRMLELGDGPLASCPLTADERIVHHLLGLGELDDRLQPTARRLAGPGPLPPSQEDVAARIAALWRRPPAAPPVHVSGRHRGDRLAVVARAAERAGLALHAVTSVPADPAERDEWLRLWQRELVLEPAGLVLEDAGAAAALEGPVACCGDEPAPLERPAAYFEVARPSPSEQRERWSARLPSEPAEQLDAVTAQFDLGSSDIDRVAASRNGTGLWHRCRVATRPALAELAQRVPGMAGWQDLVLPAGQLAALRGIAGQMAARGLVGGLGVAALFTGPSGTGKTLAAQVLANELDLDLFRIDLSAVVNKYVGETEKRLRAVFDAAESGSAILLFDEADALFGRRSEVRDSHDRYANIEVGYLLQRMEAHRGLAILTTNLRGAIDTAFLRRVRFVVQFPHPDAALREEIWQRAFDGATEGLDHARLARLDVNGATIRNIAIHATFEAAREESPVRVEHVRRAALREYGKLDRSLTQVEAVGLR
jgi:ATPase family protein associated with various cellular activities (AAA)